MAECSSCGRMIDLDCQRPGIDYFTDDLDKDIRTCANCVEPSEGASHDLIARAKKVLAQLDDADAQWLRFKVADAGERLAFRPGYSRPTALRMQRLGLVSKSTQRGTWLVEPLGQIVNGVRVARLSNTHRACLTLLRDEEICPSDRAEPVIRQYGDRGKQAIADLRGAGLVDVLHMKLTDVGRMVTRMVAEGAGGDRHG